MNKVKVGNQIKFWSNKVFGVPVDATVIKVHKNGFISLKAYYWGHTWKGKIHPDRVLPDII